jgi:ParB family transcriptional regulator, chromosome partitioning protein
MKNGRDRVIKMIPIEQINVLNPRRRGKLKFRQIVDSIGQVGLKKPITVAVSDGKNGHTKYDLACGQGRLEAFKSLGQKEIPAIVIKASKEELLLISLVENLARRKHSSVELAKDIRNLKDRGYSYSEISSKTGLGATYIRGVIQLLSKGEEGLVTAVERRLIPVSVAVMIANADDKGVQRALTDAYERGELRGKALLRARRLIESRRNSEKKSRPGGPKKNQEQVSSESLLRAYRKETARQRLLIQKAKLCETKLLFSISAIKQLFQDDGFVSILKAESLDTLPSFLSEQIHGEKFRR